MVVFVDLDYDEQIGDHRASPRTFAYDHWEQHIRPPLLATGRAYAEVQQQKLANTATLEEEEDFKVDRPNPNLNGFSAALGCYPVVVSIATHLDLNTLHDLSRTCRQFRVNLLQYRKRLMAQSLRCSKESDERSLMLASRFRESHAVWNVSGSASELPRITSGKVGKCARDQVNECRRCGVVVCRNCITKPPPIPALKDRHRRLCKACIRSPLARLIENPKSVESEELALCRTVSNSSSTSASSSRMPRLPTPPMDDVNWIKESWKEEPAFTAPAFCRGPCLCAEEIWLCQSCGHALRAKDTDYKRGWIWRARYSTYLGGLGTGIGEGNEGVPCGRASACCDATLVEQEVDCDAEALRLMEDENADIISMGRSWEGGGFAVQEIEAIGGGHFKMKRKKLVLIGRRVQEFEAERSGLKQYLAGEVEGEVRSWCSWCERVVPSKRDLLTTQVS